MARSEASKARYRERRAVEKTAKHEANQQRRIEAFDRWRADQPDRETATVADLNARFAAHRRHENGDFSQDADYFTRKGEVANAIRELEAENVGLSNKTVANVVEIAKHLIFVRPLFRHGQWGPWLRAEFAWSERTSARYWNVALLSRKLADLADLKVSVSVLYLLAEFKPKNQAASKAFTDIIELARRERVTMEKARDILYPLRYPISNTRGSVFREFTPSEKEQRKNEKALKREDAIRRFVRERLPVPQPFEVFRQAFAELPNDVAGKLLITLGEDFLARRDHPSRFDGSPDFDKAA